ncbi:MAG: hypothetical protein R3D02_15800, partial [Hyphomicrobiales bacterium]
RIHSRTRTGMADQVAGDLFARGDGDNGDFRANLYARISDDFIAEQGDIDGGCGRKNGSAGYP